MRVQDVVVGVVLVSLFSCLVIVVVARALVMLNRYGARKRTVQVDVHLILVAFAIVRLVDMILRCFFVATATLDGVLFATNRIAMLLLLAALHLVLFNWAETVRKTVSSFYASEAARGALITGSDGFIVGKFGPLRMTTALIFIFTLACIVVYFVIGRTGLVGTVIYDINALFLVLLFLFTSLGFLVFGSRLRARIARLSKTAAPQRDVRNVSLLTTITTVCFAIRVVVTTWQVRSVSLTWRRYIVSPDFLTEQLVWLWLFGEYIIPEILPTLVLLLAFSAPAVASESDDPFGYYLIQPWKPGQKDSELRSEPAEPMPPSGPSMALVGEDALRMS